MQRILSSDAMLLGQKIGIGFVDSTRIEGRKLIFFSWIGSLLIYVAHELDKLLRDFRVEEIKNFMEFMVGLRTMS